MALKFDIIPKRPQLTAEEEAARRKLPLSGRWGVSKEEFAADLEISGLGHLLKPEEPVVEGE
jgi:hypothetical protein